MLPFLFVLLYGLYLQPAVSQSETSSAQETGNRIVLSFSGEGSSGYSVDQQQLDRAHAMGINLIEIEPDNLPAFSDVSADSFLVFLDSGIQFPVAYQLGTGQALLADRIHEHYREAVRYFSPEQIAAVSVFQYPAETDSMFVTRVPLLTNRLRTLFDAPLYYLSAYGDRPELTPSFDFVSAYLTPGRTVQETHTLAVRFDPPVHSREALAKLQEIFYETDARNGGLIMIPAAWFFGQLGERPELETVFTKFLSGTPMDFPLPEQENPVPAANWSVVLLFVIWASFILHFRFQPIYASSLTRYFFSHTFFVLDIMERRIRNMATGSILLIQHAFLTGLFLYVSTEILVSDKGLAALSHHFPTLFPEGRVLLSLFFIGVILALVLQTVSVIWIYLLNNKLKQFSQILNLYSWPLHINLLVVTLLVVFNQQGSADVWIFSLSMIFTVVWFFSFNLAAIDSARFLSRFKVLNLFFTVGVHVLLIMLGIWTLLTSPSILEPIQLAISLP